jgi:hypothetical protein
MNTTTSSAQDSAVLARLERIAALDRCGAQPQALLTELRALLHDAQASTASFAGGEEVVERLRTASHGT